MKTRPNSACLRRRSPAPPRTPRPAGPHGGRGRLIAAVLIGLVCVPAALSAQQNGVGQTVVNPPRTETPLPTPLLIVPTNIQPDLVTPAAPSTYVIGDNDLLSIFIYQMPEMTRQVRVSMSGGVRVPFATKTFQATGKTALELQQDIASDLRTEGLVRAPVVQATVVQVESKPIIIGGAVQRPIVVQAARPMRLLEVLASAGGLASTAGNTVLITTNDPATGTATSSSYSLTQLIRFNNKADDPLLEGNEMVTVLPARMIYVVGDFKQPGAFPLAMGEPITVLKAIALARGLDASPNRGAAQIIQTMPDGSQKYTRIRLDRILDRKDPDPELTAGDILYVSTDAKRQVLMAGLTDVAQLLTLGVAYHFP